MPSDVAAPHGRPAVAKPDSGSENQAAKGGARAWCAADWRRAGLIPATMRMRRNADEQAATTAMAMSATGGEGGGVSEVLSPWSATTTGLNPSRRTTECLRTAWSATPSVTEDDGPKPPPSPSWRTRVTRKAERIATAVNVAGKRRLTERTGAARWVTRRAFLLRSRPSRLIRMATHRWRPAPRRRCPAR